MQLFGSLSLVLSLTLSAVSLVAADSHNAAKRHSLMRRNPIDTSLSKRFSDARFTYYAAGLGACGKTNSASDFIVAMNSGQYSGGSHCFESITITVGGKSTQAQVMDECPGCPYGGLDFSEGLFKYFSSLDAGVLTGSWVFGSGGGGDTPTTTQHKAAPTSTWEAPKTTWTPEPKTTSTQEKTTEKKTSTWSPPSSSASPAKALTTSSTSTTHSTTSTSSTAAPSTTDASVTNAGSVQDGTIYQLAYALAGVAGTLSKAAAV